MNQAVVHVHRGGPLVALVGNPNCGKTALFNLLTGSRQKVANYAGATVERKEGRLLGCSGRPLRILDLPGAYSLYPRSPDERVTCEVLAGQAAGEKRPDLVVCVVDATRLRRNLRLVLAVQRQGLPVVVALNMSDRARAAGVNVDAQALAAELGAPVVPTVGVRAGGEAALRELIKDRSRWPAAAAPRHGEHSDAEQVQALLQRLGLDRLVAHEASERIDALVLHPVAGPLLLAMLLFAVFQAVFVGAAAPMEWIQAATEGLAQGTTAALAAMGAWPWVSSLLTQGVIAGVGGVLVFLPQILILFFFILLLEDSGYLPRAAFLLDNLMGRVGLSGRAFIPLLSSFACAVPGVMATRTIANPRDRLATIMIAPLMTCSARLPVYALLIGAFVPERDVGAFNLRGLTLFALYVAGVVSACIVAWCIKRFWTRKSYQPLMLELPPYRRPSLRSLALGLWERTTIFLRRVGTIIFSLMVVLWFLSTWPAPPAGATGAAIQYSLAGQLGQLLQHVFAPVGFNWQISIALVPGLAAREVAVGALGTVYALSAAGDAVADSLTPVIAQGWSLATAYALLAWYVFAPQCLSTLAVVKRETNSWRYPLLMLAYLFALAYAAAFVTYRVTLWLGG